MFKNYRSLTRIIITLMYATFINAELFSAQKLTRIINNNRYSIQTNFESKLSKTGFLNEIRRLKNWSDDVEAKEKVSNTDRNCNKHIRYQTFYNGFEILGGEFTLHIKEGYVYKANGTLVDNLSIDVTPQITAATAIEKAKTAWRKLREQGGFELQIESTIAPQLAISAINREAKFTNSNLRLSYIIDLNDRSIHDGQTYFINAQTGEVVFHQNNIMKCNPATVNTHCYGQITTELDDPNTLTDACRNIAANIVTSTSNLLATEVFWKAQRTYDYMLNEHNIQGTDGNNTRLNVVMYDSDECNAFASTQNNILSFYVGKGTGTCGTNTTGLDDVAHEYCHRVLRSLAGLQRTGHGASIHEGSADILGTIVENYYYSHPVNNWIQGEESNCLQIAGRSLSDPNNPAHSDFPNLDTYSGSEHPEGHFGAGVVGHAFYLLTEGSANSDGVNDNGYQFCIEGIGMDKAADVFMHAIQNYYSALMDYVAARSAWLNAAIDLYGEASDEVIAVIDAWDAVGVSGGTSTFPAPIQNSLASGNYDNSVNFTLSHSNASAQIYYTLNGTNVRTSTGAVSSSAILYTGENISISNGSNHILKARAKVASNWSSGCNYFYTINKPIVAEALIINEVHYNPNDSTYFNPILDITETIDGDNFEFVEIKNISNQAIQLNGTKITGDIRIEIDYQLEIQPGSFVVFAENALWFEIKYGFAPDGDYKNNLSNDGGNIYFRNFDRTIIDYLEYKNEIPWDTIPDDGLYSLAYIVDANDNNDPTNWSAQNVFATPRAENNFCALQSNGIVNANEQVSFKAGDYIELTDSFEVEIGASFEVLIDGCE